MVTRPRQDANAGSLVPEPMTSVPGGKDGWGERGGKAEGRRLPPSRRMEHQTNPPVRGLAGPATADLWDVTRTPFMKILYYT